MINWTIKIQQPILTIGMSFQVKYRKLPSTVWVSFSPNPTTNEFTIPNLENGDYEAEIRTICTNGELSNPVYHSNAAGQICPVVTDLTYTENAVDPSSYMYRSFTFNWTRQNGATYRLEFQKNGISVGFNDNASGINSNVPVIIYGINPDMVRVVTICGSNQINSNWVLIPENEATNPNIFITDYEPSGLDTGHTAYKLHVENEPFIGYANTVVTKSIRLKTGQANFSPYGLSFNLLPNHPVGNTFKSTAVNIPIGIYDCSIQLGGMAISDLDSVELDGAISYGLSPDYYSGICSAEAHLFVQGFEGPE